MDLTVFGHTGFIGSAFVKRYAGINEMWLPPRWSRRPDPYKKTDMLYLISTTHNYNVFTDPTLDVNTNLMVLTETLDSWKRNNPEGVFNYVSSWFVYGGDVSLRMQEQDLCLPRGFYSITKRCAEKLVESFAETFDLKYRILRLCNIIGPGDKGASKQKNALQYLINEMKAGRDIELYNGGDFLRTYMHVDDCARAMQLVMLDGAENTIYNIGTEPAHKFSDLINYAAKKINTTSQIRSIPVKEFHRKVQASSFSMDCSRLNDLGFTPHYSIQQTLDQMII